MNKISNKKLGDLGEKIARRFLERKGYKILDNNYSPKFISGPKRGEIDIVAEKDKNISFVEVKTLFSPEQKERVTSDVFSPEQRVDYKKRRTIIKIAESWLTEKKIPFNAKWQIDVIAIKISLKTKKAKLRHFENIIL